MHDTDETETLRSPYEEVKAFAEIPTQEQLASWREMVPNHTLRFFSPDSKRGFILRGMTGLEMKEFQENVIPNAKDPDLEFKLLCVAACCSWTNATRAHKLDVAALRTMTAGLPLTLFSIIEELSDFFAPMQVANMCIDL